MSERPEARGAPAFATVVLDIDSTLSGIEGIDWLAARRSPAVAEAVVAMTAQVMEGALPLEQVYERRLELVRPARSDIDALSRAYVEHSAPGAGHVVDELRRAGVRVVAVSGGIRQACAPFCATLGLADSNVFAVTMTFAPDGSYAGVDTASPLLTATGKPELIRTLGLPRPLLAVGDGITDLAIKRAGEADAFAAFTGFVSRATVCANADHVIASLVDLIPIVFPGAR